MATCEWGKHASYRHAKDRQVTGDTYTHLDPMLTQASADRLACYCSPTRSTQVDQDPDPSVPARITIRSNSFGSESRPTARTEIWYVFPTCKALAGAEPTSEVELVNCVVGGFVRAKGGTTCLILEFKEISRPYVPMLEPPATYTIIKERKCLLQRSVFLQA
jgi:hypothetical protein